MTLKIEIFELFFFPKTIPKLIQDVKQPSKLIFLELFEDFLNFHFLGFLAWMDPKRLELSYFGVLSEVAFNSMLLTLHG